MNADQAGINDEISRLAAVRMTRTGESFSEALEHVLEYGRGELDTIDEVGQ
jgi:hypothetical protein